MSKLFRQCLEIAYRGKIDDATLDKMLIVDADKEIAELQVMLAIVEEKQAKIDEQNREQELHNENKD